MAFEYREKEDEIIFKRKSMSIKEKIKWTIKLWLGFEQKLKVKVRKYE